MELFCIRNLINPLSPIAYNVLYTADYIRVVKDKRSNKACLAVTIKSTQTQWRN